MKTSISDVFLGNYNELLHDRNGFQRWFCDRLEAEPGMRGRVLDIGCGPAFPGPLARISRLPSQLDGVDPAADISGRTDLTLGWPTGFEDAAIPEAAYDLAFAYNVVEHIATARPFFEKVSRVLKPGGVFWALTPHALHPFAYLVRAVQGLRFKQQYARNHAGINDYPAYYRLNCVSQVTRAVGDERFAKAEFYRLPCMNWDSYFAPPLRFIPHAYDRVAGVKRGPFMLLFAMQLTRASD
jgi:SAM-dependent methyltransferase